MIGLLTEISGFARTGDYADAALKLNQCILRLQSHVRNNAANGQLKKHTAKINYSLETMFLMLKNNDWIALADIIDFEFIPLWKEVFPEELGSP
ncbi:MAG: hypothetical protein WBM07_07355 [Chitinivibrionales bacterium]